MTKRRHTDLGGYFWQVPPVDDVPPAGMMQLSPSSHSTGRWHTPPTAAGCWQVPACGDLFGPTSGALHSSGWHSVSEWQGSPTLSPPQPHPPTRTIEITTLEASRLRMPYRPRGGVERC